MKNILFVSSEVTPFAKTGGLADVSSALPKALKELDFNVKVVMPRYYKIDKNSLEHLPLTIGINLGSEGTLWAGVYKSLLPNSSVEIYFIDYELFFGRAGLYDENGFAYSDNDKRFIFLSKAALELSKALNFKPDIIHANDWHTAPIPIMLKTSLKDDQFFKDSSLVLTIHNLQHQGVFDKRCMDLMGLSWDYFKPEILEVFNGVNLLKGGIYFCDAFTTVSEKYAKEIQTGEFGFGLDGHIRAHSYKLKGILNGVDYDEWSPKIDPFIKKRYDVQTLKDKDICKEDLQEISNLKVNKDIPLIGFVGRFAEQKGIGLIASIMERLMKLEIELVMLGSGEKWAEGFFGNLNKKFPEKFHCFVGYDNALSHKIEAGSDMFLMPSLFEPCGLNQIYSLRYGTLPIVRAVGGLDDTIVNYEPNNNKSNGFKFYDATSDALLNTINWAVDIYKNQKNEFKKMQERAMKERFSWKESAKKYKEVYEKIYHK